jgi:NAD(P)-dependent dehydrogenase (short-subunit alcohol dehydrogenase family)
VVQFGPIDRLTEADWQWVLDVNVVGMARTIMAFLPGMRARSSRRHVVLTASSSVLDPGARLGAYTVSKFAVMGLGETLRLELAAEDIGVSILIPGPMSTRHLESSAAARPAELGPSTLRADDIEAAMADRGISVETHAVPPEFAIRNLMEGIRENSRYIITHGAYRQRFEERYEDLRRSYDRMEAS